jgi:peptidoglycan/xylan/chitin deacetylase (PgdA/CDA1 family)
MARLTRVADAGARRLLPVPDPGGRRVVLCYHSVDPRPSDLALSPQLFEAHLEWLGAHCEVVSLAELVAAADRSARPRVAITFDDGYADNHTHALPSLAARDMPAAFFLTAGFLERDAEVMGWLAEIWRTPRERLAPLAWSQVEELRAAGMTLGSHTWSHRNLARLEAAEASRELTRSRQVLEERLAEPVSAVAYPWGKPGRHVTPATFALAARAGYALGVFSLPRSVRAADGPLSIPRFGVGAEPVESLAAKVRGAIDWHGAVHERIPAPLARALWHGDVGLRPGAPGLRIGTP